MFDPPAKVNERRAQSRGEGVFYDKAVRRDKELGEVVAFNPESDTYQVNAYGCPGSTEPGRQGSAHRLVLPRKVEDPGTATALPVGTIVIVDWSLGFPYIDGTLNTTASAAANAELKGIHDISGGSAETSAAATTESGYYRSPTTPADMQDGDWVRTAPSGNRLGVFNGGYTLLAAGPSAKAKLEAFQRGDLLRATAENYEVETAMGFLKVHNEEGRCALRFRAAADQLTEAGKGNDHWTFKLDIGDHGDFFTMAVCGADGSTKASVNITADGRVTILSADGLSLVDGSTKTSHIELASTLITKVMGDFKELVQGTVTQTYEGTRSTKIAAGDSRTVGGNDALVIQGNQSSMVMGSIDALIRGGAKATATPKSVAVETHVLNGSVLLELGNVARGASIKAKAGLTLAANNGDITLGINPKPRPRIPPPINVNVILNTRKPGSVILGGTKQTAIYSAVLFEPLFTAINTLTTAIDTHVHAPKVVGPPMVPVTPVVAPLLNLARSIRVKIGA